MNIIYNLNGFRILESYLCFSVRCMSLMFLTSDGCLNGYLYELLSELKTHLSYSSSTKWASVVSHIRPVASFVHCI